MNPRSEQGFSLIELLVATLVLLIVTGVVMTALRQSAQQQQTIWNRTEMHSGVRGATELMQQEVGQAGRVATPVPVTLTAAVAASPLCDPANPGVAATAVGPYASWLNQVEIWFNRITQRAIRRGTFRSVKELVTKIDQFVENDNQNAQPFAWTATADSIFAKVQRLCERISGTGH